MGPLSKNDGAHQYCGGDGVTPCPDEVHSICNCRGTYVHQVPLQMIKL